MERYLNDKRIDNTWAVIKIADLPDDVPVLAVQEFPNKSLAEFHLVEYCLIPKSLLNTAQKAQECDATESDQGGAAGNPKIPSIAAGNQIPGDDLADIAFDRPFQSSEDLIEQLQAENLRLKSWKRQATEVMPDYQELGKLMGLPLGAGVSENIIPYIKKLQAENQKLRAALGKIENELSGEPSEENAANAHLAAKEALNNSEQ